MKILSDKSWATLCELSIKRRGAFKKRNADVRVFRGIFLRMAVCGLIFATQFAESSNVQPEYPPSNVSIRGRSPEQDAKDSLSIGRVRFLGIGGYVGTIPGVDKKRCRIDPQFVDYIPGTRDGDPPANDSNLRLAVIEYAKLYNALIAREYFSLNPTVCADINHDMEINGD